MKLILDNEWQTVLFETQFNCSYNAFSFTPRLLCIVKDEEGDVYCLQTTFDSWKCQGHMRLHILLSRYYFSTLNFCISWCKACIIRCRDHFNLCVYNYIVSPLSLISFVCMCCNQKDYRVVQSMILSYQAVFFSIYFSIVLYLCNDANDQCCPITSVIQMVILSYLAVICVHSDCNVWFVYLLAVFVDKFHVAADNHVYIYQ